MYMYRNLKNVGILFMIYNYLNRTQMRHDTYNYRLNVLPASKYDI